MTPLTPNTDCCCVPRGQAMAKDNSLLKRPLRSGQQQRMCKHMMKAKIRKTHSNHSYVTKTQAFQLFSAVGNRTFCSRLWGSNTRVVRLQDDCTTTTLIVHPHGLVQLQSTHRQNLKKSYSIRCAMLIICATL